MKVLVIGGTRFIGYHLVRRLLDDGHQVVLFNRGQTPDDFNQAVRRMHGDRNNRQEFSQMLGRESFDVVVDMIAFNAEDSASAVQTFAGRVGHFFHISTGSVYLVTKDFPCPLREEDFDRELYPKPPTNDEWWLYGFHKRGSEEVLRRAYERTGFPATILRLPIVVGERDHTLRAYSYFLRIEDGGPIILPDGGLNVFTLIYVGDIAKTIASNLGRSSCFGQAYNLAQPEFLTARAFVLAAARFLDRQPELVDIPTDILERVSLGTQCSPFSMRRPFILATERAQREMGFQATPFLVWLEKTIRWCKEEYHGPAPSNYQARGREIEFAEKFRRAIEALYPGQDSSARR